MAVPLAAQVNVTGCGDARQGAQTLDELPRRFGLASNVGIPISSAVSH